MPKNNPMAYITKGGDGKKKKKKKIVTKHVKASQKAGKKYTTAQTTNKPLRAGKRVQPTSTNVVKGSVKSSSSRTGAQSQSAHSEKPKRVERISKFTGGPAGLPPFSHKAKGRIAGERVRQQAPGKPDSAVRQTLKPGSKYFNKKKKNS